MADAVEKRRSDSSSTAVVKPQSAYSKRFVLANLLVVAGFVGVLVLFGFLVSNDASKQRAWSDYKPKGTDVFEKAQNMVNHVAPRYRYGGAPIAVIQAQPLLYRDAVVDGIAFTRPPLRQVGGRLANFEPSGSTIAYVFCGQAQKCTLPQSGADQIGLLLQRESLELALYTFKYWPDVRSIVTLLPANQDGSAAVFIRRSTVQKFLDKPLDSTLPNHRELTAESLTATERSTIDRVVVNNTFLSRFEQVPNGRTLLLLSAVNR
jgi:hypothetical protein